MQRYVAFISGLPAGQKAVGMQTLRSLLLRLGFLNVETFLTTGNVILDTAPVGVIGPLEAQISRHLRNSLNTGGIWTFIRTPQELSRIVANVPFTADQLDAAGGSLFVILLWDPPDDRTARKLSIRRNDVDELRVMGREIYWLRKATEEAVPPPPLAEILDAPATVRSFNTIRTLAIRHSDHARDSGRRSGLTDTTESERSRQ
jgi:uncharacterized protein (DUF1697 family)